MENVLNILIADDDPNVLEMVADGLFDQGFGIVKANNSTQALKKAAEHALDCLLLDYDLGPKQMNGIELGQSICQLQPNVIVIIMTGYHNIKFAVEAMRRHSFQYLIKPFRIEQILGLIERAQREIKLTNENLRLNEHIAELELEIDRLQSIVKELQVPELSNSLSAADKPNRVALSNERIMKSYERQKNLTLAALKKK